ncbi:MAG: hypothetical protein A3G93_12505 [Nitrospinae bacterium RIFCSPLOWO2_12_FULL_45_22]|nr:MAG: hypothetical protein A3G93_12505 [Nitrospinae bacterium RIFCSPLOWO2_12_FULL_45_22]
MPRNKGFFTKVKDFIVWNLVKALMRLIQAIPWSLLPRFSHWIGNTILKTMPRRKGIALNNLEIALGEGLSNIERENILKKSMSEVVLGGAEILRYLSHPPDSFLAKIDFQGKEYLDQALRQGRGVICFGAHFGNFPLMLMALANTGYPVFAITREPKNARLAHFFDRLKEQAGIGYISDKPKDICLRRALQCLRGNNILFLQIDLNVISGAVWAEFFGKLVPTYPGAVILALRTGAPLIPLFIYRRDTLFHKIVAGPPIPLDITGNKEKDLVKNLSRLNKVIEEFIRQDPTAWWWLHRRWRKARPLI